MEQVAGYCLHNDYSERAYQFERGGQWVKGKSCDTFAPLGPESVPADEVDPHKLRLWLKVNGQTIEDSNTAHLIFGVPFLISYIGRFMAPLPGDVISTGRPSGVGLGFKPPRYLKSGDVVVSGIDGLGEGGSALWLVPTNARSAEAWPIRAGASSPKPVNLLLPGTQQCQQSASLEAAGSAD